MEIHQFLYLPNSSISLLARDLLENLKATIELKEGKIIFKVPEDKLILPLGLTIDTRPTNNSNYLEQILNQVYPGVWDTNTQSRSKWADPFKTELQTGVRTVVRKQYPLRLQTRK